MQTCNCIQQQAYIWTPFAACMGAAAMTLKALRAEQALKSAVQDALSRWCGVAAMIA
jgi:hypothetical protein